MKFELTDGVSTLSLDMVTTLALAVLLLIMGYGLRKRVRFLQKFCIPAPVIGGLIFSFLAFILKEIGIIEFKMDTVLQSPLMVMFFTTVGIGGSFNLLKKGGATLVIYWVLAGILALTQTGIGVTLANLTGIESMYGIMAGAASMVGGHGGAAAFGETAETVMGVSGSITVAMSAATFGLISGSLIGGPIARFLIERNNLKPTAAKYGTVEEATDILKDNSVDYDGSMYNIAIILTIMVVGSVASGWLSSMMGDLVLPAYVGAMFVAVIFRNLNDKLNLFKINYHIMDLIGDISLGIFLSMALMTLKLWELAGVAGPLLIIVIVQVVFISLYGTFIVFRACGKDFDAAVMVSGLCGHGMGATPNAMANMSSVTERYGPSSKAFLIVPIVGAFLIDIIHIPGVVWFMNMIAG